MERLPVEIWHLIAYECGVLDAVDVVALASCSKTCHNKLLGDAFAKSLAYATAGLDTCLARGLWTGVLRLRGVDAGPGHELSGAADAGTDNAAWMTLLDRMAADAVSLNINPFVDDHGAAWLAMQEGRGTVLDRAFASDFDFHSLPAIAAAANLRDVVAYLTDSPAAMSNIPDLESDPEDEYAGYSGPGINIVLALVAARGWADLVKKLVAAGADPSFSHSMPLYYAAELGHVDAINALLESDSVDVNAREGRAIAVAAYVNERDVVQLLISRAGPNPMLADAACSTAKAGNVDILRDLLATGTIDLVADGPRILDDAIWGDAAESVTVLLEAGARPRRHYRPPCRCR
ncbi:uncharacterized protein AMSG_04414 [Thecamonas trahens ATCC 50062]|uniref:Uncharacterized protein n=1 Tax=Thecamonas trahens ATCC 50062 TaxID=461836 RepID=A0A0L0D7L2_THETB|nr:hypothetical protein AMSG_04414 [Thecamonas trahens ATCC 50062]KNC48185.1 hypothetical protein AMSG_04414 [Thecamonas trahens ATCC 50062]|eukprot:XP_013758754.1 hypothetical protein AMSG_04414 [Thecamonas trahens ATCC 50062]